LAALALCAGCTPGWEASPGLAATTAKAKNAPMLLYYAPRDRGFAELVQKQIFANERVAAAAAGMVKAWVRHETSADYFQKYRVPPGGPWLVICRPDGERALGPYCLMPLPHPEVVARWMEKGRGKAMERVVKK